MTASLIAEHMLQHARSPICSPLTSRLSTPPSTKLISEKSGILKSSGYARASPLRQAIGQAIAYTPAHTRPTTCHALRKSSGRPWQVVWRSNFMLPPRIHSWAYTLCTLAWAGEERAEERAEHERESSTSARLSSTTKSTADSFRAHSFISV